MKVVIPTYRGISWIVGAYTHLHVKHWGAAATLLAEDDYSEGRLELVRVPKKWIVKGEVSIWHFSDVLIWYLEQISDKTVIVMLADYLIREPINMGVLGAMREYVEQHDDILRCQVGDDGGYHRGTMTDTYQGVEVWEGNFLPSSLTPAMWNRELLLEMLDPGCNPWWVELRGRDFVAERGCRSIAPSPGILKYTNALRGRDMEHIVLTKKLYEEIGHFVPFPVSEGDLL